MSVLGTPPADGDRMPTRGRRVVESLAVLTLVLALVGGVSLAYNRAYGTWWSTPTQISYCDRRYAAEQDALPLTYTEVQARAGSLWAIKDVDRTLRVVATVPPLPIVGRPVLAIVAPALAREEKGLPCAMSLYLETDTDSYVSYRLSDLP
ncbi:MAG: hypothetical protein ABI336_08815 [Humibacillus sp.]